MPVVPDEEWTRTDVAQGHGEKPVGIVVAQVLLHRERQPAQVVK